MPGMEAIGPMLGILAAVPTFIDYASLAIELLGDLNTILREQSSSSVVLSFRPIQAQRIDFLQHELLALLKRKAILEGHPTTHLGTEPNSEGDHARQVLGECESGRGAAQRTRELQEEIDTKLHTYAKALRDYETFSQESVPDITPKPNILKRVYYRLFSPKKFLLLEAESEKRRYLMSKLDWKSKGAYNFRELNRESRLEKERRSAFAERLWMGAFGGVALIGPMLIMVLHRDLETSIITASVATAIFVLVLGFGAEGLGGKDVLAATAAYAAVLVVFVGISMTPIS